MPSAFDYFLRNADRIGGQAIGGLAQGKAAAFDQEQELRQQVLREALAKQREEEATRDRIDRMGSEVREEGRFRQTLEAQQKAREQARQDAERKERDTSLRHDVEREEDRRHAMALENLRRTPSDRDRYLQGQLNQRDVTGPAGTTGAAEVRAARTGARQAQTDFNSMLGRRPRQNQYRRFDERTLSTVDDPAALEDAMGNWRADSTAKAGAVSDTKASLADLLGEETPATPATARSESPERTAAREDLSRVVELISTSTLPDAEKQRRIAVAMQRYQQSQRGGG